jgi:Nucleotidyltransferase domain.
VSGGGDWAEWSRGLAAVRGGERMMRAVETLLREEKVAALWISGSRAVGAADEHSDVDIRIHAPGWTEGDFETWLAAVQPETRGRWRLSKLGPAVWNYECLFTGDVPLDLLVFATPEAPVVSADSVVFKSGPALKKAEVSLLVKETPAGAREARALLDGAEIDLQKFPKLFARGERLGAWFLLEAVRFSVLRLAYVAVRGKDCGPKAVHTLASLKAIRKAIEEAGGERGREWLRELEAEGTLEESAARMERLAREMAERLGGEAER